MRTCKAAAGLVVVARLSQAPTTLPDNSDEHVRCDHAHAYIACLRRPH